MAQLDNNTSITNTTTPKGSHLSEKERAQIEILHKESGKPYINITPYLRKILREKFVEDIDVSISHCKQYSMAVVQI